MSRNIWKAQLLRSTEIVELDGCEKVLDVQLQGQTPTVWFIHDDALSESNKHGHAVMVFTGHEIDLVRASSYQKTLQLDSGFVVHVFAAEAPIS